jgi:hypothetical protein
MGADILAPGVNAVGSGHQCCRGPVARSRSSRTCSRRQERQDDVVANADRRDPGADLFDDACVVVPAQDWRITFP